ncbi:hypothetical protein WT60_09680 [Burkholderia sp. MSMB617WGS]|nr:hypothetical protein WS86_09620 [Burkholderia savannae]AOK47081.1 hypothetical protein WT60_09680 [Burkholderia sp. MSMB617WGS]
MPYEFRLGQSAIRAADARARSGSGRRQLEHEQARALRGEDVRGRFEEGASQAFAAVRSGRATRHGRIRACQHA